MLTTSQNIPGSGSAFGHNDPLAQLSKVPWDKLDRFQLSKLCKALNLRHKNGETHDNLVSLVTMSITMRRVNQAIVMKAANEVLREEAALRDAALGPVETEQDLDPFYNPPVQPPAHPDTDALLELAAMTIQDLKKRCTEMGIAMEQGEDRGALVRKILATQKA